MKKIILSFAVVALFTLNLTSCDKNERKCYKFTYEKEIAGAKIEKTLYEWCSANEADAQKEALEKELGIKVTRSIASTHKTIEDCIAASIEK